MICLWQWKYFFILLLPNFFHNWVFLWLSSRVFLLTQKPKPSCKVPIWHSGWHTWETLLCLPSGMIGKAKRPFFRVKKPQLTAVVVLFSTRDRKLHFVRNFFHTVRKDLNLANKKFVITHTSRISIENWVECWKSQKSGLTYVNSCICFIFIYRIRTRT